MMNKDVKAGWVAKLRSGNFEQGFSALHEDGKYCCLGVLLEQENLLVAYPHKIVNTYVDKYSEMIGTPSKESREITGLDYVDQTALICMNDSKRHSFSDIADWIEANVEVS